MEESNVLALGVFWTTNKRKADYLNKSTVFHQFASKPDACSAAGVLLLFDLKVEICKQIQRNTSEIIIFKQISYHGLFTVTLWSTILNWVGFYTLHKSVHGEKAVLTKRCDITSLRAENWGVTSLPLLHFVYTLQRQKAKKKKNVKIPTTSKSQHSVCVTCKSSTLFV